MIQFLNVSYVYNKNTELETVALHNVNLTINEHEFIGIIGHTGSGKSTLIQLINRLEKPTSGQILYNSEDINKRKYDITLLRKKVGVVFQYPEYQLFGKTVIEDVCFGLKALGLSEEEKQMRATQALKSVEIGEKDYLKSPFELSGGGKKRVAIAGVLAMEPEVLILDEPTAALDPSGRSEILKLINEIYIKKNITVIWVSHNMDEVAKYARRVVVMDNGNIIMDGPAIDTFSNIELLEQYGLKAPEIVYVVAELNKRGYEIKLSEITARELAKNIKKWC